MPLLTAYCDVPDYIGNATANVETNTLIGGNTTLSSACVLGATTLSIPSAAGAAFGTNYPISAWLLDANNSEVVSITNITTGTVTLGSGTLAAHAAGVSLSSAGVNGCLADTIIRASSKIERICRQGADGTSDQSLFQKSRTEVYKSPTMRCAIDRDNTLLLRPYHFPIVSVASATIQTGNNTPATVSLTNSVLPLNTKTIEIPYAQIQGTYPVNSPLWQPFPRATGSYVTVTYTAGPIAGTTLSSIPERIRAACFYLTTDLLADRQNPQGAASVRRGDVQFEARLRGDTSGKSILVLNAERELAEYMTPVGF